MKKNKNKNKSNFNITYFLTFFLVGAICGIGMAFYLDSVFEEYGLFLSLVFKLLIFGITYYAQMIIHEAGHLVAGLISGYKFGSFRAGSIIFVNENGKIKIRLQSIAGTGGQCLMTPPPMVDGKFPFVFYNLGGVLMNILTLPLCVLWLQNAIGKPVSHAFSVLMFFSGLIVALTNGIPLKFGMVNNDGSNIVELCRNKEARMVFHNQFMVMDSLRRGIRLKEMPSEYFFMPSDEGMKNSVAASGAVFLENRLIDEGKYLEALELINKLLSMESALIGLHKSLLLCDKMTLLLILDGEKIAEINAIYNDKNMQTFFKQMKKSISIIRTEYAHALICRRDEKRAEELLASFEKYARTDPYPVEVETERELIERIKLVSRE